MRTLLLPPLIFTTYTVVLLSVVWLLTPRPAPNLEQNTICIAAVELGFSCDLRKHQGPDKDAMIDELNVESF